MTFIFVKAKDLNSEEIKNSSKKLKATKSLGYCHHCYNVGQPEYHNTKEKDMDKNFKRHVNSKHSIQEKTKECQECHQKFDRGIRYSNHLCTKVRRSPQKFTKYTLRPLNSVLEVLSRQNGTVPNPLGPIDNNEVNSTVAPPLSKLQMHTICHSGKASLFWWSSYFLGRRGDLTL